MICRICNEDYKHLGLHIQYSHNINQNQYYNTYIKNKQCNNCCHQGENCLFCNFETIQDKICCPACNKYIKKLGIHIRHSHKEFSQQNFYDMYIKKDGEGICKCCGKPTPFISVDVGYNNYCNRYCLRRSKSKKIDTRSIIHICKICNFEAKSYNILGHHLKYTHNLSTQDYYNIYFKQPDEGICKTCGKETNFLGFNYGGYAPYCSLKCANSNKDKRKKGVQTIRNKNNGGWISIPEESKKIGQKKRKQSLIDHFGDNYGSILTNKGKEKREKTCLEKYGSNSALGSNKIREKGKVTSLKKYGVECPASSDEIRNKIKNTNLEKYGVEYAQQNAEIKKKTCDTFERKYGGIGWASQELLDKTKQTNIEKYGVEYPTQNKEIYEKIRQTSMEKYGTSVPHSFGSEPFIKDMLEKYGVENSMYVPKFKKKMKQTYVDNNGGLFGASTSVQEKIKQTSLEKYGTERPVQSECVQDKIKQTNVERYGVENVFESEQYKQKIKETMLNKYGVENIQQLPETKKKSKQTYKENKLLDNELEDTD